MPCTTCAFVELSNCLDNLVIQSDLPAGEYTLLIDRQLSRFSVPVTTGAYGEIIVDLKQLPKGLFNPYGGHYFIQIEGHNIFAYPEIGCVCIEIIPGNWVKNVISLETILLQNIQNEVSHPSETISFTAKESLSIPYFGLRSRFGPVPTIQVWVYDEEGRLVNMNNSISFDKNPPDYLNFDFGGMSTGIIIIS